MLQQMVNHIMHSNAQVVDASDNEGNQLSDEDVFNFGFRLDNNFQQCASVNAVSPSQSYAANLRKFSVAKKTRRSEKKGKKEFKIFFANVTSLSAKATACLAKQEADVLAKPNNNGRKQSQTVSHRGHHGPMRKAAPRQKEEHSSIRCVRKRRRLSA